MAQSYIGRRVEIKSSGDWGIIRAFDGVHYHVGIFGDTETLLIFERDEIVITRKAKQ